MRGEAVPAVSVTQQLNTATYVWEGVAAREPEHWAGCDESTFKFGHPIIATCTLAALRPELRQCPEFEDTYV